MLLVLDDVHKQHLSLLNNLDSSVIKEFCKLSIDHLHNTTNPKVLQNAAQRLKIELDILQSTIDGLSYLFTEAAKIKVTELELQDSIIILGFNEATRQEITQCYLDHEQEIRTLLTSFDIGIPYYRDLEWRIDVELSNRSLRRPKNPVILMRWEFEQDGKRFSKVLETDPVNLVHMTEVLDQALQEAKSQHARRIMRNIK